MRRDDDAATVAEVRILRDGIAALRAEIARQRSQTTADQIKTALAALVDHVERQTCRHEDTHRGGFIWTFCDGCGRKWADDQGGFVPYSDPPALAEAKRVLDCV